jgi:hypothetical protein
MDAKVSDCRTPLPAALQVDLGGKPLLIRTVGDAYHFINRQNDWLEHHELHQQACGALEAAADNEIQIHQATAALRALLSVAKLV